MLLSVNAGQPQAILWNGREFTTSIVKRPITGRAAVRGVNVAGDDQADRSVHGGPTKALYAYADEDYAFWRDALALDLAPGHFGDNLTTRGIDVNGALLGERWRVGATLLEVSEPRIPCFKLGWRMQDAAFPKRFAKELRPGAYLRIIEEGEIGAGDAMTIASRPSEHDVTVREIARIRLFAQKDRARLLAVPTLSLGWRGWAASEDDED